MPTGMTFIIPSYVVLCTLYIVTLYIRRVCHIGVGFIVVYLTEWGKFEGPRA